MYHVPLSTCIGVKCGSPWPLEHGLFQGADYHAGSSVVYQCNPGFYLLGDAKVLCTNSGKWGGNTPACLGKTETDTVDEYKRCHTRTICIIQFMYIYRI